MNGVCPKCGLPETLCVCGEIAKESAKIKVRMTRRRFGKIVTTVTGLEGGKAEELGKEMKKMFACGGTVKKNEIELQGNHLKKIRGFLIEKGFKEELIDA